MTAQRDDIEVTPAQAREMVERENAQLIDVREPDEWAAGRIAGARHIPLDRLSGEAASIDSARPVVFNCHSGVRSLMAAQAFVAAGYDAVSLAGGLVRWAEDGLPIEPPDGEPAGH